MSSGAFPVAFGGGSITPTSLLGLPHEHNNLFIKPDTPPPPLSPAPPEIFRNLSVDIQSPHIRMDTTPTVPLIEPKKPTSCWGKVEAAFIWVGEQIANLCSTIYFFFAYLCLPEAEKISKGREGLLTLQKALSSTDEEAVHAAISALPFPRSIRAFAYEKFTNEEDFDNLQTSIEAFEAVAQSLANGTKPSSTYGELIGDPAQLF